MRIERLMTVPRTLLPLSVPQSSGLYDQILEQCSRRLTPFIFCEILQKQTVAAVVGTIETIYSRSVYTLYSVCTFAYVLDPEIIIALGQDLTAPRFGYRPFAGANEEDFLP